MVASGWEIEEAQSFERGVAACGGHRVVEEAIAPVKLGLNRNPGQFLATKYQDIYLAKTKTHWRGSEIVMGYSIWFKLLPEKMTVSLLWIEWTNPDEGIEDGWQPGQ